MSDIRQTVGDLDTLLTSAFDGTEFVEVFPTSGGVSKKTAAGTAVSSDVQTSLTDTTAGRLMKAGAFGLGESGFVPIINEGDTLVAPGFYRYQDGTSTGTPPEVTTFNVIHTRRGASGGENQLWMSDATTKLYFRRRGTGSWNSFQEILSTGNYPSDTAWTTTTTLLNGWTGTVRYIKRAGWVIYSIDDIDGSAKTSDIVLSISVSNRPSETIRGVAVSTTEVASQLAAGSTGNLVCTGSTSGIRGQIVYPVIT